MNHYLHILILIEIYTTLALSLNLQLGYTGLMNFGMGIFYGLGAYSYALLSTKLGWWFIPSLFAAVFINMLFSLIISLASERFKGDIFILVCLAFQMIGYAVLYSWGGESVLRPNIFGWQVITVPEFALFGMILMSAVIGISYLLYETPFARTLQAIRDDEIAALTLGKSIVWFKIRSVAISSGIAALAGVLHAGYFTYIDAKSFGVNESIGIIFILILGGLMGIRGSVLGAISFFILEEVFRGIGFPVDIASNMRNILFAIAIILLLYYRPKGLAGKLEL